MIQAQTSQSSKTTQFFLPIVIVLHLASFLFLCQRNCLFNILLYPIFGVTLVFLISRIQKRTKLIDIQKELTVEKINLINESLHSGKILSDSLDKKNNRYASLKQVLDCFNQSLNVGHVGTAVAEQTQQLFSDSDNVFLYLINQESHKPELLCTRKKDAALIIKEKHGDLFDEWVLRHAQPLLVEDSSKDFRFDPERVAGEISRPVNSVMIAPIIMQTHFIGLLRVESTQTGLFSSDDLRFLSTVSHLAAVAMENSLLYEFTEELAIRDGLTGLYLRRYLDERGKDKISHASRQKKTVSVLMIDVDYFKHFNDKYGHHLGDIVLVHIADLLKGIFHGQQALVSRFGGEEFAVILPGIGKKEALVLADNVRKGIHDGVIYLRRSPIKVTVSIGVASYPDDADSWIDLIKHSDVAMYKAKQEGRNKVCYL